MEVVPRRGPEEETHRYDVPCNGPFPRHTYPVDNVTLDEPTSVTKEGERYLGSSARRVSSVT